MNSIQYDLNRTILLVDDESLVRRTCRRMLSRLGYEVLDAKSGEEAVALYRDNREHISLVLLDLIMPTMSGQATYTELRELNPQVKIIFSSGYPEDEFVEGLVAQGAAGYVRKPFGMKELSDKVHDTVA